MASGKYPDYRGVRPIEIPVRHEINNTKQDKPQMTQPQYTSTWPSQGQTQGHYYPQQHQQYPLPNQYPHNSHAQSQGQPSYPPGQSSPTAREIPIQHMNSRPVPNPAQGTHVHPTHAAASTSADVYNQTYPTQQNEAQHMYQYPHEQSPNAAKPKTQEPIEIPIKREDGQSFPNRKNPSAEYSAPPTVSSPAPSEEQTRSTSTPERKAPKTTAERNVDIITEVINDVKSLEARVNVFQGLKAGKEYKFLEEMLTRSLIKLDAVEAGALDKIRLARKEAVRLIQAALDLLELKACAWAQNVGSQGSNRACAGNKPVPSEATESEQSNTQKPNTSKDDRKVKDMRLDSGVSC